MSTPMLTIGTQRHHTWTCLQRARSLVGEADGVSCDVWGQAAACQLIQRLHRPEKAAQQFQQREDLLSMRGGL